MTITNTNTLSLKILLCLLPLHIPLIAQHHYKQYTVADGLPTNSLYQSIQDREGYIWICSDKGISKFDGYSFKNYTVSDGLPTNDIWGLTEDSQGRIWIQCHTKQFVYIYKDSIHYPYMSPEIKRWEFSGANLFKRNDNELVFNTSPILMEQSDSIIIFDRDFFSESINQQLDDERCLSYGCIPFSSSTIFCYFRDKDNLLTSRYVLTNLEGEILEVDSTLIQYTYNQQEFYYIQTFNFNNKILISSPYAITLGQLNQSSARRHLWKDLFDIKKTRLNNIGINIYKNSIQAISNEKCIAFDSLLNISEIVNFKEFAKKTDIGNVLQDRAGNFWISTQNQGLFFLTTQARNAITFKLPSQKSMKVIKVVGTGEKVFFSTNKGGLYELSDNEIKTVRPSSNTINYIFGLVLDEKDNLFFGDIENSFKININNTNKIKQLNQTLGIKKEAYFDEDYWDNIKDFYWDEPSHSLLIAASRRHFRVQFHSDAKCTIIPLEHKRLYAITQGKDNIIWGGGNEGLCQYINDSLRTLPNNTWLEKPITKLTTDSQKKLLVGTHGYGVYAFDEGQVFPVAATKGDIVSDIFVEGDSMLWVASNKGIKQIRILNSPDSTALVKIFTTNDGLASNEVNAIYLNKDYIFAGLSEGLTRIDRKGTYHDESLPLIYIKSIRINETDQALTQPLKLKYFQNQLDIDFTGLSYKSVGQLAYFYQLDNVDKDWQITENRSVRYPNLPPGNYTFRVKTVDIEGRTSEIAVSPPIIIAPPWWTTLWFKTIIASFLIGLSYFLYRRRIQAIQEKAAEKNRIELKFAGLEMQALQAQMNPHFVFNALTAIQYFIRESDIEQADDYLAKFGYLMRLFLESSKKKYITLEEELNLIKNYVELEEIRFENKFETQYNIDSTIDLSITEIPSLLLQPFIENAINHGLFHKKEKGYLKISILAREIDNLEILILDNGIGRKRASEFRNHSIKNYTSRGLQIVNERIEILKQTYDLDIQIDIEDVFPQKEDTGTKITIFILNTAKQL